MSTPPSVLSELCNNSAMLSLRPPEVPLPPSFPTLAEVVQEAEIAGRQQPMHRRLLDLYDGVVGDLSQLLEDYYQSPQKYGEQQGELLERLASGSASLTELSKSDRLVLNLAVIDYLASTPEKPVEQVKVANRAETRSEHEDSDGDENYEDYDKSKEPETRAGGVPDDELPAHWWRS